MDRQEPWKFSSPAISAQIHPNKLLRALGKIILLQSQTFGQSNLESIMVIKHSGFRQWGQPRWTVFSRPDHRPRKPSGLPSSRFHKGEGGEGKEPGWGVKEPTKCQRKAAGCLTLTESGLLTGLFSGGCREVLQEPERSTIQQAVK